MGIWVFVWARNWCTYYGTCGSMRVLWPFVHSASHRGKWHSCLSPSLGPRTTAFSPHTWSWGWSLWCSWSPRERVAELHPRLAATRPHRHTPHSSSTATRSSGWNSVAAHSRCRRIAIAGYPDRRQRSRSSFAGSEAADHWTCRWSSCSFLGSTFAAETACSTRQTWCPECLWSLGSARLDQILAKAVVKAVATGVGCPVHSCSCKWTFEKSFRLLSLALQTFSTVAATVVGNSFA